MSNCLNVLEESLDSPAETGAQTQSRDRFTVANKHSVLNQVTNVAPFSADKVRLQVKTLNNSKTQTQALESDISASLQVIAVEDLRDNCLSRLGVGMHGNVNNSPNLCAEKEKQGKK